MPPLWRETARLLAAGISVTGFDIELTMLELHTDVLEACVRAGEADMDNSVIIKEVRRRGVKS